MQQRFLMLGSLFCLVAAIAGCPNPTCDELAAHIYDECAYVPTDGGEGEGEGEGEGGDGFGTREEFLAECEAGTNGETEVPAIAFGFLKQQILEASCEDIQNDDVL